MNNDFNSHSNHSKDQYLEEMGTQGREENKPTLEEEEILERCKCRNKGTCLTGEHNNNTSASSESIQAKQKPLYRDLSRQGKG